MFFSAPRPKVCANNSRPRTEATKWRPPCARSSWALTLTWILCDWDHLGRSHWITSPISKGILGFPAETYEPRNHRANLDHGSLGWWNLFDADPPREGRCTKGESCSFAHSQEEIGQPVSDGGDPSFRRSVAITSQPYELGGWSQRDWICYCNSWE